MAMLGCRRKAEQGDAIAPRELFTARGAGVRRTLLKKQARELVMLDREARCKAGMDAAMDRLDKEITHQQNLYGDYLETIPERADDRVPWEVLYAQDAHQLWTGHARKVYRKEVETALRGSRMVLEVSP